MKGVGTIFLCNNCGTYFAEPRKIKETHNLDTPPFEVFFVCPKCKNDDYAYTERCTECGRYIDGAYIQIKNRWICDSCYKIKNIF